MTLNGMWYYQKGGGCGLVSVTLQGTCGKSNFARDFVRCGRFGTKKYIVTLHIMQDQ